MFTRKLMIINTVLTIIFCLNCVVCNAQSQKISPAHVFIVAGQSNTDGRVKNKLLPSYIKAMASDTVNFDEGSYKYCKILRNSLSGEFVPYWPKGRMTQGVWSYDAVTNYYIEQALQEDFYVIKYAVGGTSIQYPNDTAKGRFWSANPEWLKNTRSYEKGGNSLLLSFTESIDAAIDQTLSKIERGYNIDAFLWHQGESDDKYASKYYENLKALISYVRTHLSDKTGKDYSKLPFVFGSIPKSNRHFKPAIDSAMHRIASELPGVFLVDISAGELQADRTHFTEKTAEFLGKEMYAVLEKKLNLSNTGFRIAKYRSDKKCAISYTFDDGLKEHATLVAPYLEKLGFRGTFWINGKPIDENDAEKPRVSWAQVKKMARKGHEISNHGWSHKKLPRLTIPEIEREIAKNDSAILLHTGILPLTFCYPYNSKNDTVLRIASKNRIDTRTKQFAIGEQSADSKLDNKLAELIKNQSWGVAMTHGITYGYDHFTNPDIFWNHLQKVKKMEDDIWVGTFREVAAYQKEFESITYTITKTKNGFTVTPTLTLDKKLFNENLTAVIETRNLKKLKVSQGRKRLKFEKYPDKVLFDFDPFMGTVNVEFK